MPDFVVIFDGPVLDQPDHPKRRREIAQVDGLRVAAPTVQQAVFHAARVTRATGTGTGVPVGAYAADTGELVWGSGPEAIVVPPPTVPQIEAPQDRTEVVGDAILPIAGGGA